MFTLDRHKPTPPSDSRIGTLVPDSLWLAHRWRIARDLMRIRWVAAIAWVTLVPFLPTVARPLMAMFALAFLTGNVVIWRLMRGDPHPQRLRFAQYGATTLEWATVLGAIGVSAGYLVLVVPGALLPLLLMTGFRHRLIGVVIATIVASLVTVVSFWWHAEVRGDLTSESAITISAIWITLISFTGLLVSVFVRTGDEIRWRRNAQQELERLDAELRADEQRKADLATFEQELERREAELAEAATRCDLALAELASQSDSIVAEVEAQLDAARVELTVYRRQLTKLSEREDAILQLLPRADLTYEEIGLRTYLTESSVKTYVHRIGVKLGLTGRITRAAVIAAAYEQGLLTGSGSVNAESSDGQASSAPS